MPRKKRKNSASANPPAKKAKNETMFSIAPVGTAAINKFLLDANLLIKSNPCVSPDFCLNWSALQTSLKGGANMVSYAKSSFQTASGTFMLAEHGVTGDSAWVLNSGSDGVPLTEGIDLTSDEVAWCTGLDGSVFSAYPCTWANLLVLKNAVLEFDPSSTIFPVARGTLKKQSLGIGARFTSLHWPACDWAMSHLGLSVTGNQNSIPRELVFDVDDMLADKLDTCDFKFIGTSVPEGHQGQSVEGMSHGSVLEKVRNGFHSLSIPWGFNADHQPIGGKYDARENILVRGCLLATYITYDLSPELQAQGEVNVLEVLKGIPKDIYEKVKSRVIEFDYDDATNNPAKYDSIIAELWPSLVKMQVRDQKYAEARKSAFTTEVGQAYYRELSIDELPGLTTKETLVTVLALCEVMNMSPEFIAPAFGFQKNFPFEDNDELKRRISESWAVCKKFGVSIGFHSGSGKSAENYNICGDITEANLEIKTSGRYTYEMGKALSQSSNASDQQLWKDWYAFTVDLAVSGCFSENPDEKKMARSFASTTLSRAEDTAFYTSADELRAALNALTPSPDHMTWFEYNFLFVLAAGGSSEKAALGDHSPKGYEQRARFYTISDEGKLLFSKGVAEYILFLAETTRQSSPSVVARARDSLAKCASYEAFLDSISAPPAPAGAKDTMTKITLMEPHNFVCATVARPRLVPRPHEALVRTRAIGVCGTDFHAYTGDQPFFTYPRVLGHELGVEVVDVHPDNSKGLKIGAKCGVLPYLPCKGCFPCRKGRPNCCTNVQVLGVHVDGGMQEYWMCPIAHLFASESLGYDQLALVETLGIGAHAVARSNVGADDTLLIVGSGPVGMAAMQFAMTKGCKIIVSDMMEERLLFCKNTLGIKYTVNPRDGNLEGRLRALNGGDLPNVLIDATGHNGSMNGAVNLVSPAGTIVFVGLHKKNLEIPDPIFHKKEITLLGSRNAQEAEFVSIIKAVEDGKIDTTPWITHRAPLAEFLENFEKWRQPNSGVIKAVVEVE